MIEGQFMDITLSQGAMTEEIFHKLILKKTGALIVAAVRAGAILGKASPPEFESVSAYGQNIGLAFQVRDDIQDFGDEKKGRKSSRPNYVALLGLQKAEIRLKQFVRAAIEALDATALKAPELRYLAWKLPDRRW
jgi:geranylgeranyl diphosphate synthase type II